VLSFLQTFAHLSVADRCPEIIHVFKYGIAFQMLTGGSFRFTNIRHATFSIRSWFLSGVKMRFSKLNPLSHSAELQARVSHVRIRGSNDDGRTFGFSK